jgi:hypothetical protein
MPRLCRIEATANAQNQSSMASATQNNSDFTKFERDPSLIENSKYH